MAFSGAYLPDQQIDIWRQSIFNTVTMPCFTNTYKNFITALDFSKCHLDTDEQDTNKSSVIFVFLIQNFTSFNGFRLTDSNYSAFSNEQEYLMMEEFNVTVLNVQDDFTIKNDTKDLKMYNDKNLKVVYLYH